ncbi:MAG: hypothetical protein V8S53_02290 [Lachnospiraceae bacterium]
MEGSFGAGGLNVFCDRSSGMEIHPKAEQDSKLSRNPTLQGNEAYINKM